MERDTPPERRPRLLAEPTNRSVVTALYDADRSLHVEEIAEALVRRGVTVLDTDQYEATLERTSIQLHHNHLPRLADAGLVEYDRETNIASSVERGSIDTTWFESEAIDDLVAHLGAIDELEPGGIHVLEGRESVIEFGRQLADEAEDELFCMYVRPDLLEEECIRRGRDAIERGVTMYLGSQNPAVRELTRNHLPEATIWEPQLDWLNTPSYPRLGRLVLVDRRKVMLAVLDDPEAVDTDPTETAIVGEGVDNPLVVLVRELLGARLDHLDYQSESFRSEHVA